MKIKAPSFWYRPETEKPELAEKILGPLSAAYQFIQKLHQFIGRQEKFAVPVLCVGNINTGGTGKTPAALALMDVIKKNNIAKNPFFVSRGYGGEETGPLLVEPAQHTARHTGDESMLLAAQAPTVVAANRGDGILLAIHEDADLILMDDGLQNPHLRKDIKFVVVNGDMGFGNGKVLPAGPLREPLQRGLENADAFIFIGDDKRNVRATLPPGKPVFTARLRARETLSGRSLAFAGIGYPEKFFASLREQKIELTETIEYPDHYSYSAKDLKTLREKAAAQNAKLITTEKDYARLNKPSDIQVLHVNLAWDDESSLIQFLKSRLP